MMRGYCAEHNEVNCVACAYTRIAALEKELAEALAWDDGKDEHDADILAAHPSRREDNHERYAKAMALVGVRHSKGSLVALVNWLLAERDTATARAEASEGLYQALLVTTGKENQPMIDELTKMLHARTCELVTMKARAESQLAEALAKLQASEAAGWAERRTTEMRTKERDAAERRAEAAEAAEASLANVRADRERLYEQNANSMVEAGAARNALAEERARCDALVDRIVCAHCGKNIAACVGRYEDMSEEKPACDECCAHGNEDGQCHPLYEDDAARDLAIAILAKRALETK